MASTVLHMSSSRDARLRPVIAELQRRGHAVVAPAHRGVWESRLDRFVERSG